MKLHLLLLGAALAAASCTHAKTTEGPKADGADPAKSQKTQARSETIRTSKTTKEMFKPDGIRKVQQALQSHGFADLKDTGQLDAKTQEALRGFQEKEGIAATGLPDYEALQRLGLEPDEIFHHEPPGERVGVK